MPWTHGGTANAPSSGMNRLAVVVAAAALAGCLHAPPVEYSGTVRVESAELISVNPDVEVVADAEKPMFFARGSYWLFHDGGWYSGATIRGRWVKVARPPIPVLQIDQPYAFVHYRDQHPSDRTAAAEVDNTQIPNQRPNFKFESNPLAFE